ncbi:hypothetical protein [Embleya scabrispora]|uniref:hypothetical protein n=1 Tax=Embleya scabrispora TaxID=159449 RepID=UPI00039F952B|nr:hypothetical protein [Streptomyces sp. SID5474]
MAATATPHVKIEDVANARAAAPPRSPAAGAKEPKKEHSDDGARERAADLAARGLLPGVELIVVEPAAGNDTAPSIAAGKRVRIPVPHTIADRPTMSGQLTMPPERHAPVRIA